MEHSGLDKRYRTKQISLQHLLYLLIFATIINTTSSFGYDSANSCSPNGKLSRRGRAQMLASIPCDLTSQAYCQLPGSSYPWHAVRRFVHENQGLMKRMYGDVRHISILRDEIQNNEIDIEDVEVAADRYSRDGFSRSSKFVRNNDLGNLKNSEFLMEPHFRPIPTTPSFETKVETAQTASPLEESSIKSSTLSTLSSKSTASIDSAHFSYDNNNKSFTTINNPTREENFTPTGSFLTTDSSNAEEVVDEIENNSEDPLSFGLVAEDEQENVAINSVYEAPTSPQSDLLIGNNIQIIESPRLGTNNITEAATISTTLKVFSPIKSEVVNTAAPWSDENRATTHNPQSQPQQTQQQEANLTKFKESFNVKLKPNESERVLASSSVKGISTTTLKKDSQNNNRKDYNTNTSKESTSFSSQTSLLNSTSSSSAASKTNIDLLSGEKLRKPTNSPSAVSTTATKPVLRDGQLFQDTMKQEPSPVTNVRGVNACPVKEEVVAPFWANNTRGEILALLNLYPFEQYVHWEKCTFEYKQMYCREGCRCEQQYRLHRLLAYDPHNECRGIFSDWFRFPSCCICKCYDVPLDFRATSRSPRAERGSVYKHHLEAAEENVKKAIYEHATDEWYRPKDEFDLFEG